MTGQHKTEAGRAGEVSKTFQADLRAALSADQAGQSYGAAGKLLRERLPALRKEALENFARGDRIAARLARHVDDIVKAIYETAPLGGEEFAICAVGGYGRGELAPYSDIDLLVLHAPGADEKVRGLLDYMLYPLWDSAMKIGHGVHTPKSAAQFAKSDIIARTAYLDARLLCGSKELFDDFHRRFEQLRRRTANAFVDAKLKEQAERQKKAGETRYLVEPDIKEGKGGLRDLQTIRWLYKYVFGAEIGASPIVDRMMDPVERRAFAKAERFLWSVRAHLHDLRGRPDEVLSFDIQPDIAERLGYADRSDMTAAERLMKHYFVTTVEVGRLTRVLCARLEEERTKRKPHLPTMLPKALQEDEAPGKPNIRIKNGRLDFASAAKARRTPRDFFRLFRAFSKRPGIDLHPDALAIISEQTPAVTSEVRRDPVIANLFKGVLTDSRNPVRTLRIMTETGLLGKYIPAFGSIVGRIDYGLYRRYTLDEHVLRCVGLLHDIHRGAAGEDHPIAAEILKKADNPYIFFLAVLLHESIWTVKKKSADDCEKLIARVTKRLGLSPEEAALAGWAAARHAMMARTAERRNLSETHAIATFAEAVGGQERLDLMLVISVCHLRIVGTHSWDEVTRRQLSELYQASSAWFKSGEEALRDRLAKRAALARSETKSRLADWSDEEKENFLRRLTEHMLRCIDTDILVRFAYLARAAENDRADAAVTVTPRDGDLEAIIYADDRPGLLADIAGAVAASGYSVRSVQAMTTEDGKALDIFAIQSTDGAPIDDLDQPRRLHAALLAAARESPKEKPNLKRRLGDRRGIFTVAPRVRLERNASEDAAVVEAEGLDRPGLLYELASALNDLDVAISSAHVATYGERAVDAFYLRDRKNRKIHDPTLLDRIENRLFEVVSAGSKR